MPTVSNHEIKYTAGAEEWYCAKCGARGLDGEHSPLDFTCVSLPAEAAASS